MEQTNKRPLVILTGPTADVHDIDTELLDDLSGKSQKDGICD